MAGGIDQVLNKERPRFYGNISFIKNTTNFMLNQPESGADDVNEGEKKVVVVPGRKRFEKKSE